MTYQKDEEKYLITGAAGQLGYALQDFWGGDEGHAMPRAHEAFDITREQHVLEWLPRMRPDAVVNCAGYTQVFKAETEREECWRTNVLGVELLCQACSENEIPLFHISTDFVFGQDFARSGRLLQYAEPSPEALDVVEGDLCYREYDPVGPVGHYAQCKALAEHVILKHATENPDFQYYIIRTGGLFEIPWRAGTNFPYIVARILLGKTVVKLPVVRDVFTNVTYVPHLVKALQWMVENRDAISVEEGVMVPVGIYHVTNTGMTTWYDVAIHIAQYLGRTGRLAPTTRRDYCRRTKRDPNLSPAFTCLCQSRYGATQGPGMPSWQEAVKDWSSKARTYFRK